ncbi:ABC transporter ATP-binding protein [Gordonia sp. ABSL1-1]|uniref:ABC transporter ATP-binding protein n=1 Tax=Gordonia sp. ABSL1-1 TaxID=3053923 RepID=UPI00257289C4|nr:ABC transporter ATP-binding protein [Gordonia sp. ABSL1-1]MDL9937125.1 ABC transporter ATP-binding protein [Gordonia sp. ABSL1-1]
MTVTVGTDLGDPAGAPGGEGPDRESPVGVGAAGLRVVDAVKTIDGVRILDGVSFGASAGRVTALLGPNGAGKSTVLRALIGQVGLDSGRVLVEDRPFGGHRRPVRVVGVLPATDELHPGRTATGHLRTVAAAGGLSRDRVRSVLATVGLTDFADVRIGEMSLGTRQRLALAVALIGDPRILILDEPHNGLDAAAIRWLRTVLRRYTAAGRTVLIASHLLGELQHLADDLVVIDDGRVVAAGGIDALVGGRHARATAPGLLEEWYFGIVGVVA